MRKKLGIAVIATVLAAGSVFGAVGGNVAQAHEGGHDNGCKNFGQWVSGELAGPGFGVIHQIVARRAPMAISSNVDAVGHAMCDD